MMKDDANRCAEPLVSLTFPARAEELHPVREVVRETCEKCGCPPALAQDLVIAIGEACQNVVRHAYKGVADGEATLEILCRDGIELPKTSAPGRPRRSSPWPRRYTPAGWACA
jgi:anti-sigma regulatory factor (Ser/Thr protein kinase)